LRELGNSVERVLDPLALLLPVVAAALAVPQFVPQFLRLWRARDPAGVSWLGLSLTAVNNVGWLVYFAASGYLTALPTAAAAAGGAAATAALLSRLRRPGAGDRTVIAGWGLALVVLGLTGGPVVLGAALTAAGLAQLGPSLWSAYRTAHPTGISAGTWMLATGELVCWALFGVYQGDPRITTLGSVGATGGALVCVRALRAAPAPASAQG